MAGRKERTRFVGFVPEFVGFVPDGILTGDTVELAYDELEVIRLLDLEKMSQEEAAARMGVSRTTVTGIYERARSKVADSLVNGKRLRIEGGNVAFPPCGEAGFASAGCPKKKEALMRVAVTYENGEIFQHFGRTQTFKLYDIDGGQVVATQVVDTQGMVPWRVSFRGTTLMFSCAAALAAAPRAHLLLRGSSCLAACPVWRTMPYRACWLASSRRAPCRFAVITMVIAMADAIMSTSMRMGNAGVTNRPMASVRVMATNTVRVVMAATPIDSPVLRNVGLADVNVASLFIASNQMQYHGFSRWRAGEVTLKKCVKGKMILYVPVGK